MRKYLRSRTIKLSVVIAMLGVIQTGFDDVREFLGQYAGLVYIAISIAIIYLRTVTTKPLKEKCDE